MPLPWQLECAIHRIGKMFSQRSKQQGSIVFHPEIPSLTNKISDACITLIQNISRSEVFFMEPFPIAITGRGMYYRSLVFYSEEEVDGSLLVGVWSWVRYQGEVGSVT